MKQEVIVVSNGSAAIKKKKNKLIQQLKEQESQSLDMLNIYPEPNAWCRPKTSKKLNKRHFLNQK